MSPVLSPVIKSLANTIYLTVVLAYLAFRLEEKLKALQLCLHVTEQTNAERLPVVNTIHVGQRITSNCGLWFLEMEVCGQKYTVLNLTSEERAISIAIASQTLDKRSTDIIWIVT